MKSDGKCIWEYCNEKCECSECANCPHYRPDYKKEIEKNQLSEAVNTNELISTFRDMADRGTLLACGGVTQEDLLIQIIGTIVKVAMKD